MIEQEITRMGERAMTALKPAPSIPTSCTNPKKAVLPESGLYPHPVIRQMIDQEITRWVTV
jgi:hypothetical protein